MFSMGDTTGHFSALEDSSNAITSNRFPATLFPTASELRGVTNLATIFILRFLSAVVENKNTSTRSIARFNAKHS